MSFEKIVESLIQDAMARGEFDDLPGKGKPIDLTEYFNAPEDVRLAQSMLKNAGMVPVEIELLKDITSLKNELKDIGDEIERTKKRKQLEEKQIEFNLLLERRRRLIK
jgi:hypothetical protein